MLIETLYGWVLTKNLKLWGMFQISAGGPNPLQMTLHWLTPPNFPWWERNMKLKWTIWAGNTTV